MPDTNDMSVLRRKLRQGETAVAPVADKSPGRALRLALTRAADRTVGLCLTVLGVTDDILTLDAVMGALNGDQMLLSTVSGGDVLGLVALDPELRAALIEIQTMGALSVAAAVPRQVTGADAALAAPVMDAFLAMLTETTRGTSLAGWAADTSTGAPFESPRAAGLVLPDGAYRLVRLSLDFGVGDRQGEVCLALPEQRNPRTVPKDKQVCAAWKGALQGSVMGAQANLNAVLHKMRMPVSQIEALALGQVIALSGTRVTSVKLVGPDGRILTTARLGKMAGQRAVRIETTPRATLDGPAADENPLRELPEMPEMPVVPVINGADAQPGRTSTDIEGTATQAGLTQHAQHAHHTQDMAPSPAQGDSHSHEARSQGVARATS